MAIIPLLMPKSKDIQSVFPTAAERLIPNKSANVFDIFLAGTTISIIKQSWNISGTISTANDAVITLMDKEANIIVSSNSVNGSYIISDIPNGTYIIKSENSAGSIAKNYNINSDFAENLVIPAASAAIDGYISTEVRNGEINKGVWVDVTLFNSDRISIANTKTDENGYYSFGNLIQGNYFIAARADDMRKDYRGGFSRSFTLTGYTSVEISEIKTYYADILLKESSDKTASLSDKVTAQGENQACDVILSNIFGNEISRYITKGNGNIKIDYSGLILFGL